MDVTDFDHSSTGCWRALIVLAVPAISTMPGVGAFNHPVWLQRYEATRARRTRLHFNAPASTMLGHPGVQSVVVKLLVRKDRHKTRKVMRRDVAEQRWGCRPIIETRPGHEHGKQQSQRIDQHMALTPLHFLAAVIATLKTSHLGGLDRLTVDARSTRGGFTPCCHASPLAQCLD